MTGFRARPPRQHRCDPPTAVARLQVDDLWTCDCERVRVVVERGGRLVMVELAEVRVERVA